MKKIIKKISLVLSICLVITSIVACNKKEDNKQEQANGETKKITLVLDWTPNTNHTGFYVAKEKGFLKDKGIELEIVQPPEDGAEALVASGKAQFGISVQDMIAPAFAKDEPLPVSAVAAIIQHNTSGIISMKDKNIVSPKDLENKKYATWDMPVEQSIIKTVMEKDGGDFNKLKLIPSTVTDVMTAIQTDVDAVWIFYAWDGVATKVKGLDTNFFSFKDIDEVFDYYTPMIIGNNKFMEENEQLTKDFLDAVKQGYEYAIENPEDAAEILLKDNPELDKDIVVESQKWLKDNYKAEVERWGYIDQTRWDNFYKWLYENKLIEKEIPEGFGFTNDYLPE